jgi:hypothetical protein
MEMTKYTFTRHVNCEHQAIKLLDGKYHDFIVSYGGVKFREDQDLDALTLEFTYDILEQSHLDVDEEEFRDLLGDILVDILENQLASYKEILAWNQ